MGQGSGLPLIAEGLVSNTFGKLSACATSKTKRDRLSPVSPYIYDDFVARY